MEINRTVRISLEKKDVETLLKGNRVSGDGYEIELDSWSFDEYKLVNFDKPEKKKYYTDKDLEPGPSFYPPKGPF